MKKQFQKWITTSLVIILVLVAGIPLSNAKDAIIHEDIQNTYTGTEGATFITKNIEFHDIGNDYWALEPITRLGALEVIKGYANGHYRPTKYVSNEEVITLLIRTIGMEADAVSLAEQIDANNPGNNNLSSLWSKGHLTVAKNIGLITNDNLDDALLDDQTTLDSTQNFIRTGSVTREQVAKWLVQAIENKNPGKITPNNNPQAILNYSDYNTIGAEYAPYVEAVIRQKIMVGNGNYFHPKGSLTRAEMAQILVNVDELLYETLGLEEKLGTVLAIEETSETRTDGEINRRSIYIRTTDGKADMLVREENTPVYGNKKTLDVPVLLGGKVTNLLGLKEGQVITYLVNPATQEVVYVYGKSVALKRTVKGLLEPITRLDEGKISIELENGDKITYTMANALYDSENLTVRIDEANIATNLAPAGYEVELILQNNLVIGIRRTSSPSKYWELSGIVKENNTTFSYITFVDDNGYEITKKYVKSQIKVEKQNHYEENAMVGYFDEMFPYYDFDSRDTSIESIEAGDIIHVRVSGNDSEYITMLSAKTNYIVKYATVKDITYNGAKGAKLTVQFDDYTTKIHEVSNSLPVLKGHEQVGTMGIKSGDVVRMLVNQVVIKPGTVREHIKEIIIDEYGSLVANIYKGKFGNVNEEQQQLSVFNSYALTKAGWGDYKEAKVLDIGSKTTKYYKDGKQISYQYAKEYLTHKDQLIYVVTSDYYGKEKVERVTFRDGRDSLLDESNVTYTNGIDSLKLVSQTDGITMDSGTIVVKDGRLVETGNILPPDYARVALNGNRQAAVVQINAEPATDALTIFRGRIASIEEGDSFEVQSQAILKEMEWIYSPVQRVFDLDYNTIIHDGENEIGFSKFLDYSEISKVDEVYTIVADGTKAKYVVKNAYARNGVFGDIYSIEEDAINIKDVFVYTNDAKKWEPLSLSNSYAIVELLSNSIIIKDNKVVTKDDLEKGDRIRVLTTSDLARDLKVTNTRNVAGVIILVE